MGKSFNKRFTDLDSEISYSLHTHKSYVCQCLTKPWVKHNLKGQIHWNKQFWQKQISDISLYSLQGSRVNAQLK